MMTILKAALIALAFAGATDADAQSRERRQPRQFGEDTPIVLQPDRAYIFYRTPTRNSFRFTREATDAELAAHRVARADALVRERARAERQLANWQRRQARNGCGGRSESYPCNIPRPEIPTEESFKFRTIEEDNLVGNEYRPRLLHQEAWSGWLIAVEPGTYRLYGEVAETQNGQIGVCYCMGSVRFEAKAGEITDMGEIVSVSAEQAGNASAEHFRLGHFVTVAPHNATMRTPTQFATLRVVPAELRAAGKMGNFFGVGITRLAPIDGVLGYRRDEVIDLRTTAAARP